MAAVPQLSERLQAWYRNGSYFSFQGDRWFYREAGDGPPLLLLHGYPTASWGFHKVWPRLTQRFRAIAPDLLGSGFSDKPLGGRYDIASLADGVEALLQARGVRAPHVLAHAYGVTTAQELLARHLAGGGLPLRSVCFVNGGLFPEGSHPTPLQRLLMTPPGRLIARWGPTPFRTFSRKLARNFGQPPSKAELRELWQLLRFNGGDRVVPEVLQYLKERYAQRERWVGALAQADIPLRLINGAADPVSGTDIPRLWQQTVPNADLVQLDPGIGHYPPLEDPEGTLAAFLAFVDAIEA